MTANIAETCYEAGKSCGVSGADAVGGVLAMF